MYILIMKIGTYDPKTLCTLYTLGSYVPIFIIKQHVEVVPSKRYVQTCGCHGNTFSDILINHILQIYTWGSSHEPTFIWITSRLWKKFHPQGFSNKMLPWQHFVWQTEKACLAHLPLVVSTYTRSHLNHMKTVEEVLPTRFWQKCGFHGNTLSNYLPKHVLLIRYYTGSSCLQTFVWTAPNLWNMGGGTLGVDNVVGGGGAGNVVTRTRNRTGTRAVSRVWVPTR